MKIFERIKLNIDQIINVPSSDPDDARRRKLLNIILVGMMIVALVLLTVTIVLLFLSILKPDDAFAPVAALLATIIGVFIFYFINRLWSGILASISFLLFLFFVITLADSPSELANGRSVFLFAIPIVAASVLIGPTSTFIFYILSSIEITGLALYAGKPVTAGIFPVFSFFFLTLNIWLSARSLENALQDLRTINLNLDSLVEQKTFELTETLAREIVLAGRNQAILDSIADGVIVFDASGISILANPALCKIIETPLEDLKGINLTDFIKTKELSSMNKGMIMGMIEHPDQIETSIQVEWGKKTLALSAARVRNSETNQTIGSVAVIRDVTREAELEKMKSTFVAVVSHELRTPLNAIMGYAEILKEAVYGTINEKQVMVTERIMVNTKRLLAMVGDLLDEARIKAGKLSLTHQPFKTSSLLETMHATMDKITADKLLYLTDELDPNMPEEITGDANRLQQILINLVNNSAKFTDKGGIHVHIFRNDPNHWTMEVTDTGHGISKEELPYIFESFRQVENSTTRTYGGFGLGLAIVKQLVELMQGEVVVSSELGKGSTFTIKLPLEDNL
jgi:PAS domain S-box-containing protein